MNSNSLHTLIRVLMILIASIVIGRGLVITKSAPCNTRPLPSPVSESTEIFNI